MSDLDAIRDRVDIVELIGETVRLQRAGRSFKGLCPFHTERTPSFTVSPERRSWHCFGSCATGGDVFSFIMRRDNLDFGEAVRVLSARAGIPYERGSAAAKEPPSRLLQANEAAAAFFHHVLLNDSGASHARTYAEARGLSSVEIRDFELGYGPDSWDALATHLRGKGYGDDELVEAGLLVSGDRGAYDRFRERLIFPIRDARGRLVGFGGRAIGDGTPKYLNTPQSPLFDKGGILYALDRAAEAIRRENMAVIVEGYLDAITAHQHGFSNVVASMGTAMNERHITLLKRYTRSVALALDADEAGLEAALRGEQLIREMGDSDRVEVVVDWGSLVRIQSRAPVEVRIFSVPSGKDPDEAIRAEPESWPNWVKDALPPFEFRLRHELARVDRASPRERMALLDRVLPLLSEVGDRTLQAQYLSQLAISLGHREDDLRQRLNSILPSARRGRAVVARELVGSASALVNSAPRRSETFCLALLLRFDRLRRTGLALPPDTFASTPLRRLFELWRDVPELEADAVPEELRDDWQALIGARLMPGVEVDPEAALGDCLRRMELQRLDERKRLLTAMLADPVPPQALPDDADGEQVANQTELADTLRDDVDLARALHALEFRLRTGREPPPSLGNNADSPETEAS